MTPISWNSKFGVATPYYKKEKWKGIHFVDKKDQEMMVPLQKIWVNQMSAIYFPKNSSLFQFSEVLHPSQLENGDEFEIKYQESEDKIPDIYLRFEWSWLKSVISNGQTIKLKVLFSFNDQDNIFDVEVFSNFKVEGLKKTLVIHHVPKVAKIEDVSLDEYFLLYKGYPLANQRTLYESGIKDSDEFELVSEALPTPMDSPLQGAEMGVYNDAKYFKNFTSRLTNKIGLVCKIFHPENNLIAGTGFLIGKNFLMSCYHVINEKNYKGCKAKFFYENGENCVEVLLKEIIHSSPAKEGINSSTQQALDYSIIRFEFELKDVLNPFINLCFFNLTCKARSFFVPPPKLDKFVEQMNQIERNNFRANIIQHPLGLEKKISFRNNLIYDVDSIELHYESATDHQSSGSPIINDKGEFFGLHRERCVKIEQILIEKPISTLLFQKLGLGIPKSDDVKYHNFPNAKDLHIFRTGINKGSYQDKETKEPYNFKELIVKNEAYKKYKKDPKNIGALLWAYKNVLKTDNDKLKNKKIKQHLTCHVGVTAAAIFKDLEDSHKLGLVKPPCPLYIFDMQLMIPAAEAAIVIGVVISLFKFCFKR